MKTYKLISFFVLFSFLFSITAISVYANSSWQWISETRPYDVLPWTALATIVIEAVCINFIPGIHKIYKVSAVVILANALSFAAPYLFSLFDPIYDFPQMLEHTPLYIVGPAYLIITIVVEAPVVYTCLKKDALSKDKLLKTVVCCNIVTTIMTAVIEHIFCRGIW